MDLAHYQQTIEPLQDYLFSVNLYNWSEPFLNRQVYDIIQYNTDHNIASIISSNLSLKVDAERIVQSGLQHLIISADGIEQEIYDKYRVNGKLEKVIDNVKAIVAAKKKFNSHTPTLEWQCLVNKHNEHSLEETKIFATSLGVNEVRFANLNFYSSQDPNQDQDKWLPTNPNYRFFEKDADPQTQKRKACFWLWRSVVVAADGDALPCCLYDVPGWSNSFQSNILESWRSGLFQKARELSHPVKAQPGKCDVCDTCTAPFVYK